MNLTDKQALELIEHISLHEGHARLTINDDNMVEEDEVLGKIYKIVHTQNRLCKNAHKDWQEEAVKLYQQMIGDE